MRNFLIFSPNTDYTKLPQMLGIPVVSAAH